MSKHQVSRRPEVESLEERVVPALTSATFDAASGTLTVRFDNANDHAQFSSDFGTPDNIVLIQQDINHWNEQGTPLLVNGGQTVSINAVKNTIIRAGGGNDLIDMSRYSNFGTLTLFGGAGNDILKGCGGINYMYGGAGDDQLNTEFGKTNFMYGEEGNDVIWGSPYGTNTMDGGAGTNYVYSYGGSDTFIYHEGAHDLFVDFGGDDTYVLVGSGSSTPAPGTLTILELNPSGYDTLDFRQWTNPVSSINLSSTDVQTVSYDGDGNPILDLQFLFYGDRVENVLYPPL